ncbi:MAG TPA: diguanylate cyclase, partial [Steroidobacteraceae bacterium]
MTVSYNGMTRFVARLRGLRNWLFETLHGRLVLGLTLLALIPSALVALVLMSFQARDIGGHANSVLQAAGDAVVAQLEQNLDFQVRSIATLAAAVSSEPVFDVQSIDPWLQRYSQVYDNSLRTVLAIDPRGVVVAATHRGAGTVPAASFPNVADRDYVREPLRTGLPFVSEVIRGRTLNHEVIVAISAPVMRGARRIGVVTGALDPASFATVEKAVREVAEALLVITDQQGRVIFASRALGLAPYADASSLGYFRSGTAVAQSGTAPLPLASGHAEPMRFAWRSTSRGWQVTVLRRSSHEGAELQKALYRSIGVFFVAVLGAIGLAQLLRRAVVVPLGRLDQQLQGFSVSGPRQAFPRLRDLPGEYRRVFRNLHRLTRRARTQHQRLAASYEDARRVRNDMAALVMRRNEEIRLRTRELAQANRELLRLSRVDPLTGLANRRGFVDFVAVAWRLGLREQLPIAFVMLDVDHFKAFNDTYGHQAGDECLRRVAEAIHGAAGRPLDLVARYGGEEFAFVLTDAPADGVEFVGECIRASVEALAIEHSGSATAAVVTVSVGVSVIVPTETYTSEVGVQLADRALYAAKRAGRNRVAFLDPTGDVRVGPRKQGDKSAAHGTQ